MAKKTYVTVVMQNLDKLRYITFTTLQYDELTFYILKANKKNFLWIT